MRESIVGLAQCGSDAGGYAAGTFAAQGSAVGLGVVLEGVGLGEEFGGLEWSEVAVRGAASRFGTFLSDLRFLDLVAGHLQVVAGHREFGSSVEADLVQAVLEASHAVGVLDSKVESRDQDQTRVEGARAPASEDLGGWVDRDPIRGHALGRVLCGRDSVEVGELGGTFVASEHRSHVQVRPGRVPGVAGECELLTCSNLVAGFHVQPRRQVHVQHRRGTVPIGDAQQHESSLVRQWTQNQEGLCSALRRGCRAPFRP